MRQKGSKTRIFSPRPFRRGYEQAKSDRLKLRVLECLADSKGQTAQQLAKSLNLTEGYVRRAALSGLVGRGDVAEESPKQGQAPRYSLTEQGFDDLAKSAES